MTLFLTPGQRSSLTALEWAALRGGANLSDAHSRGWISGAHKALSNILPELYEDSIYANQEVAQATFLKAFYARTGQVSARESGGVNFYYSASQALGVAAMAMAADGRQKVGLITPTFDNLPPLIRRSGLNIVPVSEKILWDGDYASAIVSPASIDALMLVSPNNPTGSEIRETQFLHIVELCASRGVALLVDASFRFFSAEPVWDMYHSVASLPDLRWFIVEDTGKAFGISEMKTGFVSADAISQRLLSLVTDVDLLNVSPFMLSCIRFMLITRIESKDGSKDHVAELIETVHKNRAYLRNKLGTLGALSFASVNSSLSVEWIRLIDGTSAEQMSRFLANHKVHILPGGPFYWNDQTRGDEYFRIALARDPRYFRSCVDAANILLREYVKE